MIYDINSSFIQIIKKLKYYSSVTQPVCHNILNSDAFINIWR
jgi:hypothetical protein